MRSPTLLSEACFFCLTVVEEKQKVDLGSLLSHLGSLMLPLPS